MKKLILAGCVFANLTLSWFVFGQATFELRNRYALYNIVAPVFDAQGILLEGTDYMAELWGGQTPNTLRPAHDSINQRILLSFFAPGFFRASGAAYISNVPGFGWAWLQVRAWDARLGSTYEEVAARGLGDYGESPLFYAQGGYDGHLGPEPQPLIGLLSFNLRPTNAVLMRSIQQKGDQIVVECHPGFKRYQFQRASVLGQLWQNVGEPTTATSFTNSISGNAQFFRVIGLFD